MHLFMDSNEISKSLGQVPELVLATNTLIKDNVRKDELIAKILQKRPQAEIPQSEIDKVTDAVRQTQCAIPDMQEIAAAIAVPVMDALRRALAGEVKQTVTDTVRSIPVEHVHTHTTLIEMTKMADKTLRRSVFVALGCCICVLLFVIVLTVGYLSGPQHWGNLYREVYSSRYITGEERETLKKDVYSVCFLPKEFEQKPRLVKQRIRRYREILKQRESEARANDGRYSTSVSLER